ncbi:hypothetical protein NQZ68_037741 [Dissostichus eleginoides]|nr:hypothetical protein NQZ68_037741 [Dissostichus eleginoides]
MKRVERSLQRFDFTSFSSSGAILPGNRRQRSALQESDALHSNTKSKKDFSGYRNDVLWAEERCDWLMGVLAMQGHGSPSSESGAVVNRQQSDS